MAPLGPTPKTTAMTTTNRRTGRPGGKHSGSSVVCSQYGTNANPAIHAAAATSPPVAPVPTL
jgi:hypothetical protein